MEHVDSRIINPETSMGAVTLRVGDLERMSSYYSGAFAVQPVDERSRGQEVQRVLGRGDKPMVRLIHTPDLPAVDPRQPGLFHTAFLFDSASSLAGTVYRAAQDARGQFVGSSDHLVSEAFYFTDPEGNGVELYTDRPRDQWVHDGNEIRIDTARLDPNAFLQEHLTEEGLATAESQAGTVGHVHLQVGDLDAARAFYVDALGFEVTQTGYRGALFVSAGGYHHHLAMNTWNSGGSGPRAASLGLGTVSVTVPSLADLAALEARLRDRAVPFDNDGRSVTLTDPWNTRVTVTLPDLSTEELMAR